MYHAARQRQQCSAYTPFSRQLELECVSPREWAAVRLMFNGSDYFSIRSNEDPDDSDEMSLQNEKQSSYFRIKRKATDEKGFNVTSRLFGRQLRLLSEQKLK